MRKIIFSAAISIDGYMEGPNGETDWCIMDEDMQFNVFLDETDTILFGRKCYDKYLKNGPPSTSKMDKELWDTIFSKQLIVFSRTLTSVNNSIHLVRENMITAMTSLKAQPGRNIWLFGGASLASSMLNAGLIDEIQLGVIPIILGAGNPLFTGIEQRILLKTSHSKLFKSGVQQLYLEPVK
ncbi:dihydrofolate reductase family protein [Chitinophaga flava]|nr:dihydrofolate reductase family protein [Chitinophaga flava]